MRKFPAYEQKIVGYKQVCIGEIGEHWDNIEKGCPHYERNRANGSRHCHWLKQDLVCVKSPNPLPDELFEI